MKQAMSSKITTATKRWTRRALKPLVFAVAATMASMSYCEEVQNALDNTDLSFSLWSASGASPNSWRATYDASQTYDGVDALWSGGTLGNNQSNGVYTTVYGSGTIKFWWAVSSETRCDELEFLIDESVICSMSGVPTNSSGAAVVKWNSLQRFIPSDGEHKLEWRYRKDGSNSKGLDAAFLDQVVWIPCLANDNFASAKAISSRAGSTIGSNVGATYESGEPLKNFKPGATNSVWWTWTAPAAGEVTFTTKDSAFDTVLGIYTGTSVSSLSKIAENDDISSYVKTSSCTFKAASGKKYYIAVAGYSGTEFGNIVLSWNQRPENDDFEYGKWISGESGSTTGSNRGATFESGEPKHAGRSTATNSVWWVWNAPGNGGLVTFSTTNTAFDTVMGIYRANGSPSLSTLETVTANDDAGGASSGDHTSRCRFKATGGSTYYIAVAGFGGKNGDIKLSWSMNPGNDDFVYAKDLSGRYGISEGTTVKATCENGEPLPKLRAAATNTVWWAWTAPFSGSAEVNTTNGTLDTVMGIYTGTVVTNLTVVRENDDANFAAGIYGSLCRFDATRGTKYYVAVSGYGNSKQGKVDLRWTLSPVEGVSRFTLARDPNGGTFLGKTDATVNVDGLLYGAGNYWTIGVPSARSGYVFDGWWNAANGGTKVYDAEGKCITGTLYWSSDKKYVHPGDMAVYARWVAFGTKYTLTRYPNGGTYKGSTGATTAANGLEVASTAYWDIGVPTRSGYTFLGWFTEATGGTKVYGADGKCITGTSYWSSDKKYINAGNLTVYAQWSVASTKYTLTRYPNGGTYKGSTGATTAANGLEVGTTAFWDIGVPTWSGHTFLGWFTASTGGTKVYGADGKCVTGTSYWSSDKKYINAGNLTVYAQWSVASTKYTLTRYPNGGTYKGSAGATTALNGLEVGTIAYWDIGVPTRSGYTFTGWFTKSSGGVRVYDDGGKCVAGGTYWDADRLYKHNGDLTVYAQWVATGTKHTLKRYPNGGTYKGITSVATATDGLVVGSTDYWDIGVPTWSGYTFLGWFTSTSGGKKVYDAFGKCVAGTYWGSSRQYIYDGDLTVYAMWVSNGTKFTLTRYPNGGTYKGSTGATTAANGLVVGTTAFWDIGVPTRSGYTFAGWFTEETGGEKVYGADGKCVTGTYWNSSKQYSYDSNLTVYAHWTKVSAMVVKNPGMVRETSEESEAIPEWAVGTFDGAVADADGGVAGVVTLTVSEGGVFSGKMLKDGVARTLSADEVTFAIDESSPFRRVVATGDGWIAWQNQWNAEPLKGVAEVFTEAPALVTPDGVELKFSASGAVTAKFGVYSCSSTLIPLTDNGCTAFLYFPPKAGEFEGYTAEVKLLWDGAAFSLEQ